MCKLLEFFWPCLERESEKERRQREQGNRKAQESIRQATWETTQPILEEAKALRQNENERRKSAETKATIYLVTLTAIVPLTAALISKIPDIVQLTDNLGLIFLFGALFLLGMAYLIAAVLWAFRTLRVGSYHRIDVDALIRLADHNDINSELCRQILSCVRSDRDTVNRKVDCMNMTHEFLLRVIISFVIVLIILALLLLWSFFMK